MIRVLAWAERPVELEATWSADRHAYVVVSMKIDGTEDDPITSAVLRGVPVQEVFRAGVVMNATLENGEPVPQLDEDLALHIRAASNEERERWAARVYAIARAYGEPPLQAVADVLGVSQSTATRLASALRQRGELD